jgi:hypothetical protein
VVLDREGGATIVEVPFLIVRIMGNGTMSLFAIPL